MFIYQKKLQFPVNIKNSNPNLANIIITQYGGPDGELAASLRYLSQRYAMPYPELKALLTDIGTEELDHFEMIGSIVHQLTRNLTEAQIEKSPFANYFVDHTTGIYPVSAAGNPFTAAYIQSKGDVITDLTEDMAAEQKARTVYDNILRLSDDPDVNNVIRFLREREIVHFQRFGEGLRLAVDRLDQKNVYAINPAFDKTGVSPNTVDYSDNKYMDNKANVSPIHTENKANVSPMASENKSYVSPTNMDKTRVSPMNMDNKTGTGPMVEDKYGMSPATTGNKFADRFGTSPVVRDKLGVSPATFDNKTGVGPMTAEKYGTSPATGNKLGVSPATFDNKTGVGPMTAEKYGTSPATGNKLGVSPATFDNKTGVGPMTAEKYGTSPATGNKLGVSPATSNNKTGVGPMTADKYGTGPMSMGRTTYDRPMDRWMDK